MNWSSVFCMFDMALTRPSLTMQLTSSGDVFANVCGQEADTSSNYCDIIDWAIWQRGISVFVKCDTIFRFFFWKLPQIRSSKFYKVMWKHTWMYGGMYYKGFVENLLLFPAVKNFWKSVNNSQSYPHAFGVLLFWDTVYIGQHSSTEPSFYC